MSVLTKLFVILLVVMSLLLASGLIVWVNRVEEFRTALDDQKRKVEAAEQRATDATAEAEVAKSTAVAMRTQDRAEVERVKQALADAQKQISDKDTQLAVATAKAQSQDAAMKSASEALKGAQDTMGLLNAQIKEYRGSLDETQKRNTDLNLALSDNQNKLAVAVEHLRNSQEEITDLKEQLDQAQQRAGAGRRADEPDDAVGAAPPAPEGVTGEIREKKNIGGVWYATISLGRADGIEKNMRLNVVDRDRGDFLGYLVVQSVEPNEAAGMLEGPRIDQIRPKTSEVRAEL